MAFLVVWGYGVNAFAGEATHVVTELQESIMTIMKKGRDLGYTGRYQSISPMVEKSHDLDTIARLVVGRHWKELDTNQRSAFVETFKNLSIATYAGRFKDYGGEQFTILSETSLKRGNRKLVTSHFVKSDGEKISFNYILHQVHDQWKIISVSVNGVSDLALKRTEYGGILRKDGFPTLIERLKSQIDKNANGL
ncbi:MAG: ABC transporter substrate-binding protein [Nitrospira sp.]|nr:ABC transporter substrate-binding protein [Nitrospira sp.]